MFSYQGTDSYSPYLAMAAALDFRASIGGDAAIMAYLHDTAEAAGALLASSWGTHVLQAADMHAGMIDVGIPTSNATLAAAIPAELLARYGTWVPTYDAGNYGGMPGEFYVRVSVQVFTELSDVQMLADAVLAIVASGGGQL
jgi:hercynylcysteine S-oxide lyase